jgi:hypothetical protein
MSFGIPCGVGVTLKVVLFFTSLVIILHIMVDFWGCDV